MCVCVSAQSCTGGLELRLGGSRLALDRQKGPNCFVFFDFNIQVHTDGQEPAALPECADD